MKTFKKLMSSGEPPVPTRQHVQLLSGKIYQVWSDGSWRHTREEKERTGNP